MKRLDFIISNSFPVSRAEAKNAIRHGRVTVFGKVCSDPSLSVAEDAPVCLDGKEALRGFIYIMMNKPAGYICENGAKDSVISLVPPEFSRKNLFTVGRLDKDTTGFLLITDDGDFCHNIESPKRNKEKIYEATIERSVTEEDIARFSAGIGDFKPAKLKKNGEKSGIVTVCEGQYHQVKRMFSACGNNVVALKRLSIDGVPLDENLPLGGCRLLTEEEKNFLCK